MLDQGGELFGNPKVHNLFNRFGYTVLCTGGYASWQNGPVERAHRMVADAIKALLLGSSLDIKFWPYAFYHVLRIRNAIPGAGQPDLPLFLPTSCKDNFKNLRAFGCRVIVPPLGSTKAHFAKKAKKGAFLGYIQNTTRLMYQFDLKSQRVKVGIHL